MTDIDSQSLGMTRLIITVFFFHYKKYVSHDEVTFVELCTKREHVSTVVSKITAWTGSDYLDNRAAIGGV